VTGIAGLVVRVRGASYFVPLPRVGFVAPVREVRDGCLVMPKGDLPFAGPVPASDGAGQAVAIRSGARFVALAVDAVELVDAEAASRARPESELDALLAAPGEAEAP